MLRATGHARMVKQGQTLLDRICLSPNQVLTHAARAAAKQLVAARGAREGLWLEQDLS